LETVSVDIAERVNAALEQILSDNYPPRLWDAMRYSVFAGGKRLRPRLTLAACSGLGGDMETAMPFACAVELIHTYSLIHDDLPDMDDDDLRRGKPTCHIIYGSAMAILAGDALLNLAYEVMSDACAVHPGNIGAMSAIARAAGARGMVAGQAADMLSENKTVDESELIYIHANKTAALIRSCLEAGGVLGRADERRRAYLSEIGENLGRAFQIRDDLLDVTRSTEEMGKPAMSDIKNNKSTYVSVFGLERAKEDCRALTRRAVGLIEELQLKDSALLRLASSSCFNPR
jgi:geranylgeranyl diphosphate synthase type II